MHEIDKKNTSSEIELTVKVPGEYPWVDVYTEYKQDDTTYGLCVMSVC